MSKIKDFVALESEEALVAHAQQLSMSRNPAEAARGRYLKAVGVAWWSWCGAEHERETPLRDIIDATKQGMANQLVTLLLETVDQPEARPALLHTFCDTLESAVRAALSRVESEP